MEQAELRASLEEALGTPPWQEWERELAYFARHLRGWTNPRSKPDDRCAIKAELRELLDDKEAIHVLTEAERMLRHDALRKLVFDEEGSVQQAAIVPSELTSAGCIRTKHRTASTTL